MPAITPARRTAGHRLTHLHENAPGVMACLNQVFADQGINIDAQMLATRGQLGYAVTDTDSELTPDALDALADITETIRVRVVA
jgi:D-3-phosphoglycerate dehydrogenase